MKENPEIVIEMFYTFTCPNCKVLKKMLEEVLPKFGNKFKIKHTLANSPVGTFRTLKIGIHSVPTLLINNKIVFRSVPTKEELIEQLKKY